MYRIVIADDHPVSREGAKMYFEADGEFEAVGYVSNGMEAYELCKANEVGVVLMDIRMPEFYGIEGTKLINDDDNSELTFRTFNVPGDEVLHEYSFDLKVSQDCIAAVGFCVEELSLASSNTRKCISELRNSIYCLTHTGFENTNSSIKLIESLVSNFRKFGIQINLTIDGSFPDNAYIWENILSYS